MDSKAYSDIIAQGKFAIIEALEGRYIKTASGNYLKVTNSNFENGMFHISLLQCEIDTLERYLRESIQIFEFAAPTDRTQERALAWFSELSPEARTIQAGYLFADRMERNEKEADRIANG